MTEALQPSFAAQGCHGGHDQPKNPTHHPRWGLVPALSSVIIGILFAGLLITVATVWLPAAVPWLIGLLMLGLLCSFTVQVLRGHRGRCLLARTLRWWLGPIGSLVDPIEMG